MPKGIQPFWCALEPFALVQGKALYPDERVLCELAEAWETSRKEREVEGYVLRGGLCQTIWGNTWGWTVRTLGQEELWGVSQTLMELNCRTEKDLGSVLRPYREETLVWSGR